MVSNYTHVFIFPKYPNEYKNMNLKIYRDIIFSCKQFNRICILLAINIIKFHLKIHLQAELK